MEILLSFLLFFVPTAIARLYVSEKVQDQGCHCRPAHSISIESYRPKCANASATDHSFSYSANSDLPAGAFIVVGVNSTWEFLDYIGCPGVSVKRLLLSDSIDEDIIKNFGDYRRVANHSDLYEIEMVRHHNQLLDIKWEDAYQNYVVAIKSILEHVAPTLEALSWVQYNPKSLPKGGDNYGIPVPSQDLAHWSTDEDFGFSAHTGIARVPHFPSFWTPFPFLTELTLRSPGDEHRSPIADAILPFNLSDWALPSLTHLHFALYIPFSVMGRLTVAQTSKFRGMPSNITHIRLTGGRVLHSGAPWTELEKKVWNRYPGAWERVMRVFRGVPTLTIRPPALLPNLTIIIQPGFPPSNDTDPYDLFGFIEECVDSKERCHLAPYDRQLNRTLSNPRVHVKLPEKAALEKYGPSSGVYSLKEAIEEFSTRSRGEDGGWSVPEPVTEEGFWWWKDGKPPLRCFDGARGCGVMVD